MVGVFTGERAEVLITVKASPEPSEAHGDTVCVAGVRLDVTPHRLESYDALTRPDPDDAE